MRRVPLYSRSERPRAAEPTAQSPVSQAPAVAPAPAHSRWRGFRERHAFLLSVFVSALIAGAIVGGYAMTRKAPRVIGQRDIDAAVMHTLEKNVLPSDAARAYEAIRGSVVNVHGYSGEPAKDESGKPVPRNLKRGLADRKKDDNGEVVQGIGTGVVIVDTGIILTNLHVVNGFDRITVTFFDGTESDADIINVVPEHDLAVIKARTIPDDLQAATLRSTADLAPGDRVIAVGFPFGIGPSASEGVVSGLKREYLSPEGKRVLTNLIQFDAAANPGNSGGPLVTMDGAVVGIVTGILNPTGQRVFVGIGFAVPIENAASAVGMSPF
jgi:S1-C subfamily serine protease